jgi:fibronectin-binding autotransporter adhesin
LIAALLGCSTLKAATITWNGGGADLLWTDTANWTGATIATGDTLDFAGTAGLTPDNNIANLTIGSIDFKAGAGAFTITDQAFTIGNGNGFTVKNNSTSTQTINAAVTIGGNQTWSPISGDLVFSAVDLSSHTLTVNSVNNTSITGDITGTGAITYSGTGSLTLSGTNNTYSGGTTLSSTGTLDINSATALGTGTFTISGAGTIDNTSGSPETLANNQAWNNSFTFAGANALTFTGTVALAATRTVTVNSSSTLTEDGVISGGGGLTKAGASTLVLGGTDTYTGATTISAGTLQIGGGGSLGASGTYAGAIADNGALIYSSSANQTFSGVISGTGSLTKDTSSTSTLTLSGNNTFTGGLNLTAGTVSVGTDKNLGGANAITLNGGTLETTASLTLGSSASHTLTVGASGGALKINSGTLTLATASQLTGTGALTLNGTGTLALNANQNFGGTLNVASGAVSLGATQTFTGGTIDLAGGTTLNLNGYNLTAGTLNITGASGSTATIDFSGSSILDLTSSLTIASGVTLDVNGWTDAMNYFYDASNPGPPALSQIVFGTPYTGDSAKWFSVSTQITPVPEPATYGAIFMATALGLFLIHQRRQAMRPVPIPVVTRY